MFRKYWIGLLAIMGALQVQAATYPSVYGPLLPSLDYSSGDSFLKSATSNTFYSVTPFAEGPCSTDPIEVIGTTLRVSGGEMVCTSSYLLIGTFNSYNSKVDVSGEGALLQSDRIYMEGRGSRLIVQDGAAVRSMSSVSVYGDSTLGIVYPDLRNGISVFGAGSLLDIPGNLSLWSPDSPGQPGDPFDQPREIPTFLSVNNGGTVRVGGEISVANGSYISLGAGGRLTVVSDFDASMNGFNYQSGGALSVEGQLSGLSLVQAGSRVEAPSILGDLTVHGTLSPGNSPGDSVISGGLVVAEDGTLEMELGGYALGTEHDRLTIDGFSSLGGTLEIVLLDGFAPTNGASFDLFNWDGGITNEFTTIHSPALGNGLEWDVSMLYTNGTLSVIPEPGTFTLLSVFGCGLLAFRRASRR